MIKLRVDSRDFKYHETFGQAVTLPDTLSLWVPQTEPYQQPGNDECTCITTCELATDQDEITYDYDNLYNRIPHSNGAIPKDALNEAVKNGLLPKGGTVLDNRWHSYYRADTGQYDAFDNVRSAMSIAKTPVGCATPWYEEWESSDILPVGKNIVSYHMYSVEGWIEQNGEPMLTVEAWIGYKVYMNRETFNSAMSALGSAAYILTGTTVLDVRKKTIIETMIDTIKNLILLYKQQLIMQPIQTSDTITNATPEKIIQWANAIKEAEGWF